MRQGKPSRNCTVEPESALPPAGSIRAVVFELDGTLYVSDEFALLIQEGAVTYLAALLGLDPEQARTAMAETRRRLATESGARPTLSAVCSALGGTLPGLHAFFQERLRPESYLLRDQRVVDLLDRLRRHVPLYLYTNNSRPLVTRILALLGLGDRFSGVFTIDDSWRAKPDQVRLGQILAIIGEPARRVLFVGDRFDVDLRLPAHNGCPVLLTRTIEELLGLEHLIENLHG
jgi:putative hydrolase of the HAD superfamily